MSSNSPIARHVFHSSTSGMDRLHAWQEQTGEPVFVWGRHSAHSNGYWFWSVKKDFRQWLKATDSAIITIYHDGLGADALGPMDPCDQKVLYLHNWFPRWAKNFEWMLRCTGKVLVSDPEQVSVIRRQFAWIPGRYIYCMNPPRLESALAGKNATGPKARTGLWLHGRSWKRYGNRLRSIIDRWPEETGELEIVTSGKNAPSWARKEHVTWSGDLPMEFALLRIHTWDSCLLLNDYSLDDPWFIRSLELGCFPLIPEGNSVSKTGKWLEDSAPKPYDWGDVDSAMKLLRQWREHKTDLEGEFLGWSKELVDLNSVMNLKNKWNAVKSEILSTRAPKLRPRKPVAGSHPVGWYERVQRLRSGV